MVDPAYYKDSWHGGFDGSEEDLRILLSRASDAVDASITMSGYTVNTAPDAVAENVKKAVCAQAVWQTDLQPSAWRCISTASHHHRHPTCKAR